MGRDTDIHPGSNYTRLSAIRSDDGVLEDQYHSDVRIIQTTSPIRSLLLGVLLGIVSAILGSLAVAPLFQKIWLSSATNILQFAPQIPITTTVNFERIHGLEGPYYDVGQDFWKDLIPDRDVLVYVPDPGEYNLPKSIHTETGSESYMLAMHHQLHCMGLIHEVFSTLISNLNASKPDYESLNRVSALVQDNHPQHCFQYMAQSIMCSADLTIEWARTNSRGEMVDFDGWNIPHQCKDPEKIQEWVRSNHQMQAEKMPRTTNTSLHSNKLK